MDNEIKYYGKDDLTERDLFLLPLKSSLDIPKEFHLPSKHFACFLVWDSQNNSIQEISELIETLVKNGVAYFCAWGNDCERLEDVCDKIGLLNSPNDSVIMTTSHKNESIEETLYFFLTDTHPDKYYELTLSSSLVIVIGNNDKLQMIENALSNPKLFSKNILDKE